MTAKDKLRKRLGSYYKLELMNIVLVPVCMIFIAFTFDQYLGWASFLAMVPMCGLLYVGGIYWRAKFLALDEGPEPVRAIMPRIARLQYPLLILSILAIAIAILVWVRPEFSISGADRWSSTTAAVIATLEYINYYHRQVQHFDHAPDIKRFFGGQGFRQSQMARDLRSWKKDRL